MLPLSAIFQGAFSKVDESVNPTTCDSQF